MKTYMIKTAAAGAKAVALDDMILTKDLPTTAGSKMLDGYMSLFDATAAEKLQQAGYSIAGKLNVGEFSFDVLGETSYYGECKNEKGELCCAATEALKAGDIKAVVALDVNGSPRRASAQSGMVFIKPTYGTVSRFGTVPVACSGETVGVMAKCACDAGEVLKVIAGYDSKDGTMHSQTRIDAAMSAESKPAKVAVVTAFAASEAVNAKIAQAKAAFSNAGITVCEIDGKELLSAKTAWNILMCAELCNNVSRYDGIKYGYRTKNYTTIDELYTNSRTEAFGETLKTAILYGSDVLSAKNYLPMYDKALRVRRVISEYFAMLFKEYDAVIMPACSELAYTNVSKLAAFDENIYTAPASITGLPAVCVAGVQIVGKAFSDGALLELAKIAEKEGK